MKKYLILLLLLFPTLSFASSVGMASSSPASTVSTPNVEAMELGVSGYPYSLQASYLQTASSTNTLITSSVPFTILNLGLSRSGTSPANAYCNPTDSTLSNIYLVIQNSNTNTLYAGYIHNQQAIAFYFTGDFHCPAGTFVVSSTVGMTSNVQYVLYDTREATTTNETININNNENMIFTSIILFLVITGSTVWVIKQF